VVDGLLGVLCSFAWVAEMMKAVLLKGFGGPQNLCGLIDDVI